MSSSSSTSLSKRRLLIVLLSLAGLLVLIETAATLLLPEGLMTRSLQERSAYITSHEPPEIQIMGDSVSLGGIYEGNLQQLLSGGEGGGQGPTVNNYSLAGTSPLAAFYLLQRQLESGDPPKLILYAPNSAVITNPTPERFFSRFATAGEAMQTTKLGMPVNQVIYGSLFKASYTLRYREELRSALLDGNFQFFSYARQPVYLPDSPRTLEEPTTVVDTNYHSDPASVPWMVRQPFEAPNVVREHLDAFANLARENGIEIVFVMLPIPDVVSTLDKSSGAEGNYAAFVQAYAAEHENVHSLWDERPVYQDAMFSDFWHVTEPGAWKLTNDIGAELQELLAQDPSLISSN